MPIPYDPHPHPKANPMFGKYGVIHLVDYDLLLIICPHCGAATQVTGTKKPHKIRRCWNCDNLYIETG